ncbi:NADP-dependent succinate-semialdehyde dehydrogenase [Paraphysoderma sedebokerense]|nr:NADP-dependent succinate-semialdehyde dehydrogenase [Paraphysoderma sedebokerense]
MHFCHTYKSPRSPFPNLLRSLSARFSTRTELDSRLERKSLLRTSAFVNGEWIKASDNSVFNVIDPANGQTIETVPDLGVSEVRAAVEAATNAFEGWSDITPKDRSRLLKEWYKLILDHRNDLSLILTAENGKPLREAKGELSYGVTMVEWFAEECKRIYGDIMSSPIHSQRILVMKQPAGVCSLITPWNFPFAMVTRKAGAALAAGCTVVLKPAHETPLTALALAELASQAGIPKGVFNVVTTKSYTSKVGKEMVENPNVSKVSFTGSTRVGQILMKQASEGIKKLSLELGGNAAFIVFEDAEIEKSVDALIDSKFRNAGQTCISPNRIFLHRDIQAKFLSLLSVKLSKLNPGHGYNPNSTIGPLISTDAVQKVKSLVHDALLNGAKGYPIHFSEEAKETFVNGVTGHGSEKESTSFYPPTILTNVTSSMTLFQTEIFGPVVPVTTFSSDDQVIALANQTSAGLSSYIFSRSVSRVWKVAEKLKVGMVGVNSGVISNEVAPFGGVKLSGLGREGGKYGLEEYLEIKYINLTV